MAKFDWFVSDIHLSPKKPHLMQAFLSFLEKRVADTDNLYILGDLFDYWIGDDYHVAAFEPVVQALWTLTDQGMPVYFIAGNRDFLVSDVFFYETGCQSLDECHKLQLHGKPTVLLHGDSLCTDDHDYMKLRATLRDPQWQEEFLAKPLPERVKIAKNLRQQSQQENIRKDAEILDVNEMEVNQCLQAHHATVMIHGHTHQPNRFRWQQGSKTYERIVLGDWGDNAWALRVDSQQFNLQSWPIT